MSFPRYSKYKASGVEWLGDVPAHWMITQLKRVVRPERQITYGIVQAGPHISNGIPYIRPADMTDEKGVLAQDEIMRTSPEIASAYSRSTVREGDIVCSIGPSFGKAMITPQWLDGANLTQGTARISVQPPNNSRYIFWTLRSPASVAQWESSVGGATFRALNLGPLSQTTILTPSETEQIVVAEFLDRETAKIDELVAEQRRLIELLKEKRQAVISHAVTKGLNPHAPMKPSGIEWLGDVPEHWNVVPLHRIVQERRQITYGIVQPGEPDETGRFMIRNQDFTNGWTSPDSIFRVSNAIESPYKRARMKANDLLMTIVGAVGSIGIVPEWLDGANTTQNIARIAIDANKADHRYISMVLQGPVGARNVEFFSKGSVQTSLNLEHVRSFWVTVPPIKEQRSIVEHIEDATVGLDALTAECQRATDLLQERRTALISAAVTGKIDVRGLAESEAA